VVEVAMAEADDYPLTGNDDLIAAGLVPEDDDIHEDATTLLGIDVDDGSVPIDVDAGDDGGGAATAIGTGSTSTHGTSSVGKRKSSVWVDIINLIVKSGLKRLKPYT
jgi:hypothetical protein